MPCHYSISTQIDYRRLGLCRAEMRVEMLGQGWSPIAGKFDSVLDRRAMQRYRGTR